MFPRRDETVPGPGWGVHRGIRGLFLGWSAKPPFSGTPKNVFSPERPVSGSNRLRGKRSPTVGGVTPRMEGRLCGACQHHAWRKSGVSQASARTRVSSVRAGGCGLRADIA